MDIEGAYDTKEEMAKVRCPYDNTQLVCFPDACPMVRFGTMGRNNGEQIKKFWGGAGEKPEFEYKP